MTQPPPSTPTPRRFPLSKRPPTQSQQRTPGSGPPVFANTQRFQATPRFAPPSATQRPLPSTPGFPGTLRPSRPRDPIQDALDSSPPDAPATATRSMLGAGTQRVNERIEIDSDDSDIASDSHDEDGEDALRPTGFAVDDSIEVESQPTQSGLEERTPKRRRISISPAHSWQNDDGDGIAESSQEEDDFLEDAGEEDEVLPDIEEEVLSDDEDSRMDEDAGLPERYDGDVPKTQPTFQRAPRFKISESEAPRQEGLPEAFSPQRRGPKYVAGGLAAELQSWLAEVKGWGGGDRPADLVMRIVIDEVHPGNRMYLVRGRRIVGDGDLREELAARLMLAGEGRLTGLGQKAPVVVGSSVAISQPAWEIVLEGTRWLVACDWTVS